MEHPRFLAILHEHHLLASAYGLHPATTFGVDPVTQPLLAYQLLRATYVAGTRVEARLAETKRVSVKLPPRPPKGSTWGEARVWTWEQAVGLAPPPPEADGSRGEPVRPPAEARPADDAVLADARAILRGEIDPATWGLPG
ncbi:MAG TPA: hypothetical protein VH475_23195 [Tepidisphaeraceae bacterium]|jgi:hypothetical protein